MNEDETGDEAIDATVFGVAALTLLEAIILILLDRSIIDDADLDDAFCAAVDAHRSGVAPHGRPQNEAAARVLDRLRVHGNSVRLDA